MKIEFNNYFKRAYLTLSIRPRNFELHQKYLTDEDLLSSRIDLNLLPNKDVIRKAILEFQNTKGNRKIRSDAKYFILLNFSNMIIKPLQKNCKSEKINNYLYDDLFF